MTKRNLLSMQDKAAIVLTFRQDIARGLIINDGVELDYKKEYGYRAIDHLVTLTLAEILNDTIFIGYSDDNLLKLAHI